MISKTIISLDVGEKRIGVAVADLGVKIAVPYDTFPVNGTEVQSIADLVAREKAHLIVVGYPRNQSGEPTKQTAYVQEFTKKLATIPAQIEFQDESLTSVMAEERLAAHGRPYHKSDIDAQAAAIILQDYIETHYD
jgi:putative Holliday junction resolvase